MHYNRNSRIFNSSMFFVLWIALTIGNVSIAEQGTKDSGLQAFEQDYMSYLDKAGKTNPTPEVVKQAKALRFELMHALIEIDARVTSLKLEATTFEGVRQQAALEDLLKIGAERQRAIARARRQLAEIIGAAWTIPQATPLVKVLPGDERLPLALRDPDRIRELRRLIGIELEPEDVTTGEFE